MLHKGNSTVCNHISCSVLPGCIMYHCFFLTNDKYWFLLLCISLFNKYCVSLFFWSCQVAKSFALDNSMIDITKSPVRLVAGDCWPPIVDVQQEKIPCAHSN